MYDWSFFRSARVRAAAARALDDAGVVAGRELFGARRGAEGEQLGEAEAAVAAGARVRRLAARVAADERLDDGAPELLAQVERHVRQPALVAGLRAASTDVAEQHARSVSGASGSTQSRSVTPSASGPARSSATALSTPPLIATAMRPGERRRAKHRPDRRRQRIGRQIVAGHGGRLEQAKTAEVLGEPLGVGVDDPLAVDPQPDMAHSPQRVASPKTSSTRPEYAPQRLQWAHVLDPVRDRRPHS